MSDCGRKVLCVRCNQDGTMLGVGYSEGGFKIYNLEPFEEHFSEPGGIGILELLYRTNLMSIVGGGKAPVEAPSRVLLWDDKDKEMVSSMTFKTERVLDVRMLRDRWIIFTRGKVDVFTLTKQPQRLLEFETFSDAETGVIAIKDGLMAIPGRFKGQVQIVDLYKQHAATDLFPIIKAHESRIQCLALSNSLAYIATASEKGTLIRIWRLKDATQVTEFRRGTEYAEILSMCFNSDDSLLAVSSQKETIHIFRLGSPEEASNGAPSDRFRDAFDSSPPAAISPSCPESRSVSRPSSTSSSQSQLLLKSYLPEYLTAITSCMQIKTAFIGSPKECIFSPSSSLILYVFLGDSLTKFRLDEKNQTAVKELYFKCI